jgi:hypothetical protein
MGAEVLRVPAGADVEKLVVRALDDRAQDVWRRQREHRPAPLERLASAAPYIRAADRSAAQSCAEQEPGRLAQRPREAAQPDEALLLGTWELPPRPLAMAAQLLAALMEEALDAPQER